MLVARVVSPLLTLASKRVAGQSLDACGCAALCCTAFDSCTLIAGALRDSLAISSFASLQVYNSSGCRVLSAFVHFVLPADLMPAGFTAHRSCKQYSDCPTCSSIPLRLWSAKPACIHLGTEWLCTGKSLNTRTLHCLTLLRMALVHYPCHADACKVE